MAKSDFHGEVCGAERNAIKKFISSHNDDRKTVNRREISKKMKKEKFCVNKHDSSRHCSHLLINFARASQWRQQRSDVPRNFLRRCFWSCELCLWVALAVNFLLRSAFPSRCARVVSTLRARVGEPGAFSLRYQNKNRIPAIWEAKLKQISTLKY